MNSICEFLGYVTALGGAVRVPVTSTCKMISGIAAYQESYSAQLAGRMGLGVLRRVMSGKIDNTQITLLQNQLTLKWKEVPFKGPPAPVVHSIKYRRRGYLSSTQVPFLEDADPATFTKCDWYNYVTYLESIEIAMFATEAYATNSFERGRTNCKEPNIDPYFAWRVLCQERRLKDAAGSSRAACCAELTYQTSKDVRMLLRQCARKYAIRTPQTDAAYQKNLLLKEQGQLQGNPNDPRMIEMPDAPGAFPYELPEPLNLGSIIGSLTNMLTGVMRKLNEAVIENLMKRYKELKQAGCEALITTARRRQPLNWINNALISMCLSPEHVKECYERRMCDKVSNPTAPPVGWFGRTKQMDLSKTPRQQCIKSCRADPKQESDPKYTSVSGPVQDRRQRAQRLFALAAEEEAAQRSKCSLQAGAVLATASISAATIGRAVSFLDSGPNRRFLRYLICQTGVDEAKRISVVKMWFRRLFGRMSHSPLPQGPSSSWDANQWMRYLLFINQRSRAISIMTNGGILGIGQTSHSLQCAADLIKKSDEMHNNRMPGMFQRKGIDSQTAFAICNQYLTHNPTRCVAFLLKTLGKITGEQEKLVYETSEKKLAAAEAKAQADAAIAQQTASAPAPTAPTVAAPVASPVASPVAVPAAARAAAAPALTQPVRPAQPAQPAQPARLDTKNDPGLLEAFGLGGGAKGPVGYKIRKLMRLGYPQKQALAIALRMHQAGRLGPRGGYVRVRKSKK
jgi:hypothetical protein